MNKIDLVKEWFEFAINDLRVATHMFNSMLDKPLEIICYHCQQCVEKAFKGYLINKDIEPPYTHDLDRLRQMCIEYEASFNAFLDQCEKLTNYITAGRYPSNVEITEADAIYALKEAESIYNFCANLLPELKVAPSPETAAKPTEDHKLVPAPTPAPSLQSEPAKPEEEVEPKEKPEQDQANDRKQST